MSFEHFLEGLKRRWWPDIGWQAIPDQRCSCVKCKRAEFSFGGWLYQEVWAGRTKLSSWFVMAQQRGQIRWCACAENFVCESSYFEMDPRCHWEPVKFIEQWSGTAQSIHLQNDAGQHVLLALKLSGQGLRHAIHDGVGVVKSGAHQSVSNQSGGVGIEDGTNVAKSSDVVLRGLLYQAYMFVESKRWINGNAQ